MLNYVSFKRAACGKLHFIQELVTYHSKFTDSIAFDLWLLSGDDLIKMSGALEFFSFLRVHGLFASTEPALP